LKLRPILIYSSLFILLQADYAFALKKVSYSGYVALDALKEYSADFPELFTKAKLEFEFTITPTLEVEVDIRGNTQTSTITLKEIHASVDFPTDIVLKIGNLKKPLGIEELTSREDLFHIEESQINEFLAPFGYLSRDPGIQIVKEHKNTGKLHYPRAGLSYNQSGLLGLNGRVARNLFEFCTIGISSVYQLCTIRSSVLSEYYPVHSYVVTVDLSRQGKSWYHEFEGFLGLDPIETQLNEIAEANQDVHFAAAKWLSAYNAKITSGFPYAIEPLVLCNILCPDISYLEANRVELLAGINLYLAENVRVSLNGDLILVTNKYNTEERTIGADSKIVFESIITW
jgi:hypothetical protein